MENENTNTDLTNHSTTNKDLWLFLIVVDVVCLCVLGFFLYRHFSTHLFNVTAKHQLEETAVEEPVKPVEEVLPTEEVPQPIAEVVVKEPVQVEKPVVVADPVEVQMSSLVEEPKPEEPVQPIVTQEKKKSVLVATDSKSKYRRVTFRWFGEGKSVSIVSGFTMSKPQKLKKRNDYWETTLSILPGTYKFLYIVDGINTMDPNVDAKDGRSIVTIN